MSLQVVCPVCFKTQKTRATERCGEPWETWYCEDHGDISHYPAPRWSVTPAQAPPHIVSSAPKSSEPGKGALATTADKLFATVKSIAAATDVFHFDGSGSEPRLIVYGNGREISVCAKDDECMLHLSKRGPPIIPCEAVAAVTAAFVLCRPGSPA